MNRQEAQTLLPWFVTGALSAEEALAVQAFIDSGDITREELAEVRLLHEAVQEQSALEPAYNPGILNNVMDRLDDVPQEQAAAPSRPAPGILARLGALFSWAETPPVPRLIMAAQFAAVLALAVALVMPEGGADSAGVYQTVSGGTAGAADLTVAFAEDTTAAQIRALLTGMNAEIVAGPNSLGMYGIRLAEPAAVAEVQDRLTAEPLIIYVQPAAQP